MRLLDPSAPHGAGIFFLRISLWYKRSHGNSKPSHFGDRLTIINPHGTIGVVTLWSKPEYVIERFRQAGVDLDPESSDIAVFGTLYGNGLREMLRNLLYNPQIILLLICGNDRSGSFQELWNFFYDDLEPVQTSLVRYISPPGIKRVSPCRINGTNRVIDDLVRKEHFPDNGLSRGPILVNFWATFGKMRRLFG